MTAAQVQRIGKEWEVSTRCQTLPEAMALVDKILARPEPAAFATAPVAAPPGIVDHRTAAAFQAATQFDAASGGDPGACVGSLCGVDA